MTNVIPGLSQGSLLSSLSDGVSGSAGCTLDLSSTTAGHGLLFVPSGKGWDGWMLAYNLLVTISFSPPDWVATTHLDVAEYGIGTTEEDAVIDLLTSLSEYRESLEDREDRLGAPGLSDLSKLRALLNRRPA